MPNTLDTLLTSLATAYGGPVAGIVADALIKVGKAEIEKRTGRPLLSHSPEEILALLDQIEIGDTAAEIAEGEALAAKNPEAAGTPGGEA